MINPNNAINVFKVFIVVAIGLLSVKSYADDFYKSNIQDLSAGYTENEYAMDKKIGGRPVEVTGHVFSVTEQYGYVSVCFLESNPYATGCMHILDSERDKAILLKNKQLITMYCKGMKGSAGNPVGSDCIFRTASSPTKKPPLKNSSLNKQGLKNNNAFAGMVNVSGDYYLDIKDGGISGIYYEPKEDGDMSPWTGCSSPVKEKVSIISVIPDERTTESFKVRDAKGNFETYDISDIYTDIPNYARGYIPLLIKEGGKINLTYRLCGSGGFPSFVSATR